jgi:hypothetical protein
MVHSCMRACRLALEINMGNKLRDALFFAIYVIFFIVSIYVSCGVKDVFPYVRT